MNTTYWKRLVIAVCALSFITGCDGDEFADADSVTAGEVSDRQDGKYHAGEQPEQGQIAESAGPITDGAERPPDHPTMSDESADQRGGGDDLGAAAPQVDRPAPADYGEAGPIRWQAPAEWQPQPPANQMRFAQYDVPGTEGGEPAELTVFYFGSGAGGGVEDNLQRWASEFSDGPQPVRDEIEIDGMTVHTIQLEGTREPSIPMGGQAGPAEDQKLLGAVAEASEGLFFFRLVGDRSTIAANSDEFDDFVRSFEDGQ